MGRTLTLRQRIYLWDHAGESGSSLPNKKCNICHQKITRFEDMELDHIKAYSKGGSKLAMVHKECNRMKANGSLRDIQKRLGIEDNSPDNKRKIELKPLLKSLTVKQLKELCDLLFIERPKSVDVGWLDSDMRAPNKPDYIKRIIKSNVETDKIKRAVFKYRGR